MSSPKKKKQSVTKTIKKNGEVVVFFKKFKIKSWLKPNKDLNMKRTVF